MLHKTLISNLCTSGAVPGGSSGSSTRCGRFFDAISRQLHAMSYLCPGLFPWVDCGPATEQSGQTFNYNNLT